MDRVEADKGPTALADVGEHLFQIAEVANAPVRLRAQRIELHAGAPQFLALFQRLRLVAAFWRHNHPAVPAVIVLCQRQGVITLRQFCRQVEIFAARRVAFMLMPLFGRQQPAKVATAFNHQRHFFARGIDHHVRDGGNRRFRDGFGFMHSIQQTPLGLSTNRLRFTMSIDIAGADPRRQGGIIETFTFHRASLAFCLPDTGLVVAD